jgi:5-methyltetrahydropteroyltriglutamate--homocysteine methyltransferase
MNTRDATMRAETVGSLLRPDKVRDVVMSGDDAGPEAAALLDGAVLDAIALQEECGLDVITDGEMRRRSWAETPRYCDCFEPRAMSRGMTWHGGSATSSGPPTYDAVVRRVSQARLTGDRTDQYAFLAQHAHTRTKFTMAAPSYHRRYWPPEGSEVYGSVEEFLYEVRDHLRTVVQRLVSLGCDYVQLDAPNYGSYCDADARAQMEADGLDIDAALAFEAALDNSLFDGFEGITRALHICRGNAAGGRWHSSGGYGAISGVLFRQLDFDRLLLEYDSERAGAFGPLADIRPGTVAVLGLLTTKDGVLEDEELVRARLAEAASVKPLQELAISTQCGFASVAAGNPVTPEQQRAKLELVARLARETWA